MSLSSCSEKGRMVANRYLTPVDTLNVEIGAPGLIKILGNQLFVDYSFSGEYNIDVIDIQHDSVMYSFAKKGQGVNEFLQIMNLDIFQREGNYYLGLFDNMQRKYIAYSIDSLNRCKEKCVPDFINKLDLNSRFLEIYEIGHKYVATGRTEKKYTLLNDDLSYNNSYCDYLTCEGRKDDAILLSKANYGRSYLSEDRKLMANVVFMSGTISVYEVNKDSIYPKWSYVSSEFEYETKDLYDIKLCESGLFI